MPNIAKIDIMAPAKLHPLPKNQKLTEKCARMVKNMVKKNPREIFGISYLANLSCKCDILNNCQTFPVGTYMVPFMKWNFGAMSKLTKRTIDALPIKDTDYAIWDSELRGFGRQVKKRTCLNVALRENRRNTPSEYTVSLRWSMCSG